MTISSFLQLLVSLRRIQEFLESDELDSDKLVNIIKNDPDYDTAIVISGHSFSWGVQDQKDDKKDGKSKDKKSKKNLTSKKDKKDAVVDANSILEEDSSSDKVEKPLLEKSTDSKRSVSKERLFST